MFKSVLTFLITLSLFSNSFSFQDAKRPMTSDDVLNMVSVGSALMSPDGKLVFYSKRTLNWDKNKYETKYYVRPTDGGEEYQFIGEDGGSSFQFSPDGKYLSLKRSVDKKSQIFVIRMTGGEAVQLTEYEGSIGSYKWSADASKIFFTARVERSKEEEKEFKNGDDMIFVDEAPNGQSAEKWNNLWVYDLASKEFTKITNEETLIGGFDISPDAKRIAYTAKKVNRRNDSDKNEIFIIDVDGGKVTRLTNNNAPEGGITWAPDGKTFAYTAADDKEWMNRNSKIYIMDPSTKVHRLLSGKYEGSISGLKFTPDSKYIIFNGQQKTNTNLFKMDASTGDFEQLSNIEGTLRVSSYNKNLTKMVFSYSDFDTPSDLYVSGLNKNNEVRITNANPWVETDLELASMKVVSWNSVKNFEIEGLVHTPANYKDGDKLPLILNIHGGPAGVFSNSFRASYHVYAGLGFASLSPNVRGSSGYTDKLREGNTVAKGDGIGFGDYQDLMKGVDKLIKDGLVDKDKMGVKGWSYGGILGGWTITQTNRFKAASIGAGVYDWTSEYGPGFNNDVRLWHIGGNPWDNPKEWRNQSTLTHVKKINTPTLLIHGMNDNTDKEQQSMMLFTAIKDIGKAPVRYIKAPREPHGFREPRHQRTRDLVEIQWMYKHILGIDWKAWERPKEKDKKGPNQ